MGSLHRITLLGGLIILLVGCATGSSQQPPAEWDGLEYRPGNESGAVYVHPGVKFKTYRTVMIDPPVIVIDSRWRPIVGGVPVGQGVAPRQLSSGEVQQIKDTLSSEIRKVLVKEMVAGGYQVLELPGDDTVRVTPVFINIYLDGTSSGRMTLVMELRDAPTGLLLGRLVDEKTGQMGILQFPDSVTENVNFRRAVQTWGRRLRVGVDKMSGQPPKT
jgi:Protein of unknown function (DUF3313)